MISFCKGGWGMERVWAERSGLQWAPTPSFTDKVREKYTYRLISYADFVISTQPTYWRYSSYHASNSILEPEVKIHLLELKLVWNFVTMGFPEFIQRGWEMRGLKKLKNLLSFSLFVCHHMIFSIPSLWNQSSSFCVHLWLTPMSSGCLQWWKRGGGIRTGGSRWGRRDHSGQWRQSVGSLEQVWCCSSSTSCSSCWWVNLFASNTNKLGSKSRDY